MDPYCARCANKCEQLGKVPNENNNDTSNGKRQWQRWQNTILFYVVHTKITVFSHIHLHACLIHWSAFAVHECRYGLHLFTEKLRIKMWKKYNTLLYILLMPMYRTLHSIGYNSIYADSVKNVWISYTTTVDNMTRNYDFEKKET